MVVVVVGGGAIFTKLVEKSGEIGILFATKSRAIPGLNYFKMLIRACCGRRVHRHIGRFRLDRQSARSPESAGDTMSVSWIVGQ